MTIEDKTITYVLRCHCVSTLPKLKTALLSVSAQTYPSVKAVVALQNLPDHEVAQIDSAIRLLQDESGLDVELRNFSFPKPGDHRGALLNRALGVVKSRYVGFLDYDDIVYPNHAETLISDLVNTTYSNAVASFGGCMLAFYNDIGSGEIHITNKRAFSKHPSVSSCIVANCFPIHSYAVDLRRLQKIPKFDEESHLHEDYVFLLELLELHPVSTRHSQTCLCEYRLNNDNSNTVSVKSKTAIRDEKKNNMWLKDQERVERKKSGRSFRVPYDEIVKFGDISILSRQPLWRGLLVCQIAKNIRKRYGVDEATKFLTNPKRYSRALPAEKRSLLMRFFF
ncbi:glycosyltransferase family 2 protein [Tritonibacter mobilis]|uniref:glycosyltransferase family 2 protein n=1 Tax=Tritonibacter mobilis TaxID=379347 RepID=UPI001403F927|nr:glycosyltransferase family 2 protein [Tritonibacter mobilis]NHM21142.1 glycosyltransferase family 2 protein [Tritonibacter mobilis]NHM25299.1 glycosyltransferase family 2 protein [Tritonibacter mobilis]